jgi:hypothetical protein
VPGSAFWATATAWSGEIGFAPGMGVESIVESIGSDFVTEYIQSIVYSLNPTITPVSEITSRNSD